MSPTRKFHLIVAMTLLMVLLPILGFIGCYLASIPGRDAMSEWETRVTELEYEVMRNILHSQSPTQSRIENESSTYTDNLAYMSDAQFDAYLETRNDDKWTSEQVSQLELRLALMEEKSKHKEQERQKSDKVLEQLTQHATLGLATAQAREDESKSWQINAEVFSVASLAFVLGAIMVFIFFYSTVSKLHSNLKSKGFDFLSFHDTAIIYASTLHLAYTLPDAATVLMLPDYGPEPDKIVYYIRDYLRYKARK